jgi:predicted transcriptional regulator
MKPMLTLTEYSQIKALSDPFRAEIMMRLMEKPYTGQQLSEYFDMSRAKIHYHLKDLEKNGLIEIVYTEEKNGILQKFYQSVASGFTPAESLLPRQDVSESSRQMFLQMNDRTRKHILSAPEESFMMEKASEDPSQWNYVGSIWEFSATSEQFQKWIKKYFDLMEELTDMAKDAEKNPDSNVYFVSTTALKIDEPSMKRFTKKEEDLD